MGTAAPSSITVQPLLFTSHSTNAPVASGRDSSIRKLAILPQSPYGLGTGNATIVGRPLTSGRDAWSGTYSASATAGANAALTRDCNEGGLRKLVFRYKSTAPRDNSLF